LLLMDIDSSLLGTTAVPCARLFVPAPASGGLIRMGTAILTGLSEKKGKTRASPEAYWVLPTTRERTHVRALHTGYVCQPMQTEEPNGG
jgi:hypothetical protein